MFLPYNVTVCSFADSGKCPGPDTSLPMVVLYLLCSSIKESVATILFTAIVHV